VEAIPALAAQHGQETARGSRLPLLLVGIGLGLLLDLLFAGIGFVGGDVLQSENARETLVGVTIVLSALFAATAMVWLKRSKNTNKSGPWLDANYLRVAAVVPLLFVDYLFAVAISISRANLILYSAFGITCLVVNLLAIRHFWRSIPAK
jgi:NADH:ubiquinone oxidoreductase subunit 6 (subunit J)